MQKSSHGSNKTGHTKMKKILFGLREEVVYGHSYPIFTNIKKKPVKIGYVSLIDNVPMPPGGEVNLTPDMRKHKIVVSLQKRFFAKITPAMFEEIQNKILTGDKTDSSGKTSASRTFEDSEESEKDLNSSEE